MKYKIFYAVELQFATGQLLYLPINSIRSYAKLRVLEGRRLMSNVSVHTMIKVKYHHPVTYAQHEEYVYRTNMRNGMSPKKKRVYT